MIDKRALLLPLTLFVFSCHQPAKRDWVIAVHPCPPNTTALNIKVQCFGMVDGKEVVIESHPGWYVLGKGEALPKGDYLYSGHHEDRFGVSSNPGAGYPVIPNW